MLVYRLGCYVVLPGINPNDLDALTSFTNRSGLMQLLDMFSGGAFSQASIFALGIMPYITASIVIQLAGMVLPSFQKMQREGESGRQKLNQYTRYLTVLILLVQGPAYLYNLRLQVVNAGGQVEMGIWTVIFLTVDPRSRLHVYHVARRAHHRPRYRQRYLVHHPGGYHRPPPGSALLRVYKPHARTLPETRAA